MAELFMGIVVLLGLVALQTGLRFWNVTRTKKAWQEAQEHLRRGELEDAEAAIHRCIKLMPLWLQPRFVLGAVLARQGKLDEAEEQIKLAVALEPRQPEGHIELGIFYVTMADRVEAGIAAFNEAISHSQDARRQLETEPRLREFRETEAYTRLGA